MGIAMTKMVMRGILAVIAMLIFGFVLWGLMTRELPTSSKDILLVILGVLMAAIKDIFGYYYGSSLDGNGHDTPAVPHPPRASDPPKLP